MSLFYNDGDVRQRLVEYLGGDTLEVATAVYVTHSDGCLYQRSELHPPQNLQWFLDRDLDIARSIADRESILLHLDVEYVNFDSPGQAYLDPFRVFELQEPVVRVIEELLLRWGIKPLHLVTGQGHHFVWRVRHDSRIGQAIAALNPAPDLADSCFARASGGVAAGISREMQGTFSALALLMEFIAHRIKWESAPNTQVPVEITAVHVGPGESHQREIISIDVSEYGDPLHTRMIRMPYTDYLKPLARGFMNDPGMQQSLPRFRAIPLHEMDFHQALACRQDETAVRQLARRADGNIPEQEKGTARLLAEYLVSPLRRFHEHFYAESHFPAERSMGSLETAALEILPTCGSDLLIYPNDRLLKPAGMQLITRLLLAAGWHPRHIAGLIRSKFENRCYDWGVNWQEYDAGTRADFYTRLFAGLWSTGVDELVDFNCFSTQQKGFCPGPQCGECMLTRFHDLLTQRKNL